jgi:hypothetical protein
MKTRFFVLQRLATWTMPLLGGMNNHTHDSTMGATWLIFAFASAAMLARADVIIREKVEYQVGYYWMSEDRTTRFKDDKARLDIVYSMTATTNNGVVASITKPTSNSVTSMIIDLTTGDAITLLEMYGQKSAVKASAGQFRTMSAQPANSDGKLTAPQLKDTKQTVMMDGYLTELYTRSDLNGVSMRLWVARDFPNYKQINGQLARLRFGFGVPVKNIDLTKVPGMVMKSEAEIGGTHPHVVIITLLSAKEAPVDAAAFVIPEDYHAVNWQNEATAGADLARIKALLKENPGMVSNKDTNGVPPLQTAAANGEMNVVELLLANKADVNARDNTGGTALDEALIYGHQDVVELLLAHNADVNARDNDGTTPLHLAAMVRNQDMLELLLAHKADVNATNNVGVSSLHEAVSWDYKEVVELLLSHKADVNAKDEYGATPLHYAASKGYKDIVELLLAHKADVNASNNMGETPLQCAVKSGHEVVAKLLRQYGVE